MMTMMMIIIKVVIMLSFVVGVLGNETGGIVGQSKNLNHPDSKTLKSTLGNLLSFRLL